jgi:hypothetical protein
VIDALVVAMTKRLNSRTFDLGAARVITAARALKKTFVTYGARQRIEVSAVTMMLRYCHTCGFCARFLQVAFQLARWLKGFCAVA